MSVFSVAYQENMNRIETTLVLFFAFQNIAFAKQFLVKTADEKALIVKTADVETADYNALRYISNLTFDLRVISEGYLSWL